MWVSGACDDAFTCHPVTEVATSTDSILNQFTGLQSIPTPMVFDSHGNMFEGKGNSVYQISTSTGAIIHTYTASGEISDVAGLAIDSHDNLFVSDDSNAKYNPTRHHHRLGSPYLYRLRILVIAEAIAFDPSGNLFVLDSGNSNVVEIATTTDTVTKTYTGSGAITAPQSIAFDSAGNLFVSDYDFTFLIPLLSMFIS